MANTYKYVYLFSEGNGSMRELLGGRGANLAEVTNLGMPVPQGFTVITEACTQYHNNGRQINADIQAQVYKYLGKMEAIRDKKFADPENPLLVPVRSGARASMPGMMDTILNLGLNDTMVEGLVKFISDPCFAYDSYRQFVQMFSDVVMELSKKRFEEIIDDVKAKKGVKQDVEPDTKDMRNLVALLKEFYKKGKGEDLPQDPKVQLTEAVKTMSRSWDNLRTNVYCRMDEIPYDRGTVVNIQSMVFGNSGDNSGTGVVFTRNPVTGEKAPFGEYLINAQGEDVVAGVCTFSPISGLYEEMPAVYEQFVAIADRLEKHYKDMQDMEFTIENGKLYMLQARNGKRTVAAVLGVAVDLVDEGMTDEKETVCRVDPRQLDAPLHPTFDAEALRRAQVVGKGLVASPDAACGRVVFIAEEAKEWHERGGKATLVRLKISPEDIEGMQVSQGILTARSGMTSYVAAVVRGMDICCVSGCGDIMVDYENKKPTLADKEYHEGNWISLDSLTGNVYGETVAIVFADPDSGYSGHLMGWANKYRQPMVYTNADAPRNAVQGRAFGAQGIGLCYTEHMLLEGECIKAMRETIVADNTEDRKKALAKIMSYQQGDFEGLYEVMESCPVVVRFLDPLLHEFLPTKEENIKGIAGEIDVTVERLYEAIASLYEFNSMMGHRGCRLAVSYPEIAEMRIAAATNAAINVQKKHPDWKMVPEIMAPLVGEVKELKYVEDMVVVTADKIIKDADTDMKYEAGTMTEIPRATLTAGEIAKEVGFFSFGTDDLTQMTFGLSRDDAGKFLSYYYDKRIYESDPFAHLDQNGVGKLVAMAAKLGRKTHPDVHLGICGEHGGDPISVEFCHKVDLNYVSYSPYYVPIARLAVVQATIKHPRAN